MGNYNLDSINRNLQIDCSGVFEIIKSFLIGQLKNANLNRAVVAISGGIDSALAATICVRVLSVNNVTLLYLPYRGVNSRESETDVLSLVKFLGVPDNNFLTFEINNVVDTYRKDLNPDVLRLGNIMARSRMIYLYDIAKKNKGLVIGTCNRSELFLGYETRYGDGACDINFLSNLYKKQVYQMANFLSIPDNIVKKSPSAELWPGQTDESELGFSYDWVDPLLYLLFDKKISTEEASSCLSYDKNKIDKVVNMVKKNEFKQLLPPTCEI